MLTGDRANDCASLQLCSALQVVCLMTCELHFNKAVILGKRNCRQDCTWPEPVKLLCFREPCLEPAFILVLDSDECWSAEGEIMAAALANYDREGLSTEWNRVEEENSWFSLG